MPRPRTDGDEGFRLDGIELVRGKRSETRLRVLELADATWLELPVIVLRGAKPGPVFYLGAAFHGDEVNGVDIATRFAGEVNLAQLRGTLIVVPAQNPLALQAQHRYFVGHFLKSPLDQSTVEVSDVEKDLATRRLHASMDGAGHDVARSQLSVWVLVSHERVAGVVAQDSALPAHGLGYKE